MSNYDNHDDQMHELADLEARLRLSKPQTDPISPTTKRRLRAQLLETQRMNKSKLTFGRLTTALAALVLIVGVPLFFWSIQSSLTNGAASQPVGAADTAVVTPTPLPATVTAPAASEPEAAVVVPGATATVVPTVTPVVESAASATIVNVGEPISREAENGAPAGTFFTVPIEVDYTLVGYEEALLVLNFEMVEANGTAGGTQMTPITTAADGTAMVEVVLSSNYLNDAGSVSENVVFAARINQYDMAVEQYVNLFPGDAALPIGELNAPYPFPTTSDYLALDAVALSAADEEGLELMLSLFTHLDSAEDGLLTAVVSSGGRELATETITVTQESADVVMPIQIDGVGMDSPLAIATTLVVGDEERNATIALTPTDLTAAEANSVWFVDTIVEAGPNETTRFRLVVGYQLSELYVSGSISHRTSYSFGDTADGGGGELAPPAGGGGGGGGGGGNGRSLPPGTGITIIDFALGGSGLTVDNWQELVTLQVSLHGVTAAGEQLLVDTVEIVPAE